MLREILQMVVILLVLYVLVVPVGKYLVNILFSERHILPERLTYRLFGLDPSRAGPVIEHLMMGG